MNSPTLLEIGARLKSSKWGGKSYLPTYGQLFAPFRDEPITLVEFGIDQGNSLLMWLEYFTRARIIGIDEGIDKVVRANQMNPRISAHCHQQQDPEVGRIMETFRPTIVIDDAGHNHWHQTRCWEMCWPWVERGGLYIIEDIQHQDYHPIWRQRGADIVANYTSSALNDYRYDDVLAIFRKE